MLTEEQRLAVETLDRGVSLIAAAGSGKTTVLVQRYLQLLRRGARPSQILTVTFTKDAAEQLRERILAALVEETSTGGKSELYKSVESTSAIGTLHSFCYGVLNQYGTCLGYPAIQRILDPFERADAFGTAFSRWLEGLPQADLRSWLRYWNLSQLRDLVKELFFRRHELRRSIREDGNEETEIAGLVRTLDPQLFEPLEKRLFQQGCYSFDDLESLALKILKEAPEARRVLREQLRFFLIDEFQDTSRLQWEILELLLEGGYENLFVVGDPKQSIYSFRHAEVRLFQEVAQTLVDRKGELLELTTNFRAKPELIGAINAASELLFPESSASSPMRAREIAEGTEPGELLVRRYGGEVTADRVKEEIKAVVVSVRERLAAGESANGIALLFRVSDRISEYASALEQAGINVSCRQTTPLFSTYEAADLVQFFRALHNPLDDFSLAGVLRSPYVGMSVSDLWKITRMPGDSLFEKVMKVQDPRAAWFVALVERGTFDVKAALEACFRDSGYWPRQPGVLMELLTPFADREMTVTEAVEKMRLWEREDILFRSEAVAAAGQAVSLMTTHGSKGLEFDHVFLVDCLRRSSRQLPMVRLAPGSPPGFRFRSGSEMAASPAFETLQEEQEKIAGEESRRILYVALTRARRSLTVFLPQGSDSIPKNTWGELLDKVSPGWAPRTSRG